MHGSPGPRLAVMPVPRRYEQKVARLEDFIEDRGVLRRGRFRHAEDGVRDGRAENLPALRSLDLDDDQILRIECSLSAPSSPLVTITPA